MVGGNNTEPNRKKKVEHKKRNSHDTFQVAARIMDHSRDSGEADLAKVEKLLQSWATKICESTNEIITSAMGRSNDFSSPGANAIFDDMRDRQSRIITVSKPLPFSPQ